MKQRDNFDLTSEMLNMSATKLLRGRISNNVVSYPRNMHHKDFSSINSPQASNDLKSEPSQNKSSKRGLDFLLEKIEPINFQERAGLKSGDRISKDTYQYYVIEELFNLSKHNNVDLALIGGFPYIFNGNYWEEIDSGVFPKYLSNVAFKMGVRPDISKVASFAKRLEEQYMIEAERIHIKGDKKFSVCVLNGTIYVIDKGFDFSDSFDKENGLQYQLQFPYDKNADCPEFKKFLNTVMPDADCQKVLAEYLGYSLTSNLKLHRMLVLLGGGDNGKSVIYDIVQGLFGEKNVSSYSLNSLTEVNSNSRSKLPNVRLNYGSEMEGRISEEAYKRLISGETIDAKVLYKDINEINSYAKLMYNSNSIPTNLLKSHSLSKRLMPIPMNVIIPREKQDKRLAEKIISKELPGILNWVLKGLKRVLLQEDFTESELINNTLSKLIKSTDSLKMFLEEEGYTPDLKSKIRKQEFYDQYKKYCDDNECECCKRPIIREKLRLMGIVSGEDNQGMYYNLKKNN